MRSSVKYTKRLTVRTLLIQLSWWVLLPRAHGNVILVQIKKKKNVNIHLLFVISQLTNRKDGAHVCL